MSVSLAKPGHLPLNTTKTGRVILSGPATHRIKEDVRQGLYSNDLKSLALFYKKKLKAFS